MPILLSVFFWHFHLPNSDGIWFFLKFLLLPRKQWYVIRHFKVPCTDRCLHVTSISFDIINVSFLFRVLIDLQQQASLGLHLYWWQLLLNMLTRFFVCIHWLHEIGFRVLKKVVWSIHLHNNSLPHLVNLLPNTLSLLQILMSSY